MARVNVETRALAEQRFCNLGDELEMSRFETIGLLVIFWHDSQERETWKGSRECIERFIPVRRDCRAEIFNALVSHEYVSLCSDGEYVIHGNRKHIEAVQRREEAAKKGGEASWNVRKNKNPNISRTNEVAAKQDEPCGEPNAVQCSSIQSSTKQIKTEKKNSSERFEKPLEAVIACFQSLSETFRERSVTEKVQQSWIEAFPDSEWVTEEIRKALAWELSNPARRKKNFAAFITRWLTKGWDQRKTSPAAPKRRGIEELLADEGGRCQRDLHRV